MSAASTFSESWYRIAGYSLALRPHVQVQRQFFRGERYYVLHDPFNNQFSRLQPAAYEFVARLRLGRSVESVWCECIEANPEEAPGQEDVIRLLAQLNASNLLHSNLPPDSTKLFDRYQKRRERETRATWLNVMYAKFPLLDPDAFLKSLQPLLKRVISWPGALLWLVAVVIGIKVIVDRADAFKDQSQAILAPSNLVLLYLSFFVVKALHELGHACVCRRLGGEVHVIGLMLMIFTPVPYVDTTSSWAFRSRWKRALVGAAGMIVEMFVAAVAAVVWAYTAPGVVNSLAYNVILVASVSTLMFNINPLMRFDGYYILSDLLDIPNLQARATKQVTHLFERYLFGCKQSHSQAWTRKEATWLSIYGMSSFGYRLLVFAAILLFLAERFLLLGVLMALFCGFTWLVAPVVKLIRYLASSPRLGRQRSRAIAACAAVVALLFVGLEVIPAPNRFRAPGVLEAVEHRILSAETGGRIEEIVATPGQQVAKGDTLLRLSNRELELDLQSARAELKEAMAMRTRAEHEFIADLEPLDSRIGVVGKRILKLERAQEALIVRAPHDGVWLAPELEDHQGAWLPRGKELGHIVNPSSFHFSAIVSQQEASWLFGKEIRAGEVHLLGRADITLPVLARTVIPADRRTLPSAALGWRSGGDIAVSTTDETGVQAREPFFEVRAAVESMPGVTLHGRSGKIRFDLPPEPLLHQWTRKLRQLLQIRYGV
ncbi:MAG TPA: biotin/lipoyl-binding protein [Chthoniobacteraceae bacterium]|jgi:putative peptide zinc metalloprotease protein